MFNNTILLFHHLFPLFGLFLSILMHFFVNNNLHIYRRYILIIPKASEFESLKIIQLQASCTVSTPYFHYVNCTVHVSIPQHVLFRLCSSFINTIAQIIKILRFCNYFPGCPLYIFLMFSLTCI